MEKVLDWRFILFSESSNLYNLFHFSKPWKTPRKPIVIDKDRIADLNTVVMQVVSK